MQEIKNINKISLAKITALIYGLMGFFSAVAVGIASLVNILQKNSYSSTFLVVFYNLGDSLLLGILTALVTVIIGWIIGFVEAAVYNWFAKRIGGVKVDLAEIGEVQAGEKKEVENNQW